MTNITPQQMRELAGLDALDYRFHMNDIRAALRTAADQLEAVEQEARKWIAAPADENAPARAAGEVFLAILTADTASQEDRDE